jgi:glucosylceramidase
LDAIGGPNHLGNECDAPLLAVPYRAKGADGVPKQEWFEKVGYPFGTVHGDQRTREELHALGVPAEYLDLGIVVQPMYYFMGHISRHVRPGSRVVNGLVDGSAHSSQTTTGQTPARAFRAAGQTVAGGGINDLARNGVELTMWPCEGSTRQQFFWNQTSDHWQVYGHDWLGAPTISCVSKTMDESFLGLTLTACDKTAGTFGTRYVATSNTGQVNIFLKSDTRKCLIVKPLGNDGGAYGPRGGAQVTYGHCSHGGVRLFLHDISTSFLCFDVQHMLEKLHFSEILTNYDFFSLRI